ncbi:MAG: FKBP-type peptidyl-prolyl cis-trans isomerase [Bacteroidetes bacterium]|nr:FKBP-type peptidyl-prolyl cis-trans isomerase [Bacteroidota bacterium]MBU1719776.1 FKBP-type peptidyl-prolyl cis-trans isomerase [Bacteroidota bacterium]
MKRIFLVILVVVFGSFGISNAQDSETTTDTISTKSGLKYLLYESGKGVKPGYTRTAVVHYNGFLTDGTKFDSSYDRGEPFSFQVGMGQVIKGWDEGIKLLKVGGKARLIIPPHLGYGEKGVPGTIPPNATLIFDVELLQVK